MMEALPSPKALQVSPRRANNGHHSLFDDGGSNTITSSKGSRSTAGTNVTITTDDSSAKLDWDPVMARILYPLRCLSIPSLQYSFRKLCISNSIFCYFVLISISL